MPSPSQRTLYIALSTIAVIFLLAFALAPHPHLTTLSIPSPFPQTITHPPLRCPHHPQQQGPLPNQHQPQPQQPTWLLATSSAFSSQRRRNIIRATWHSLYQNPAFDKRFVIANPDPLWLPLIKHENDTYGDLIVLEHLAETAKIALTIKPMEMLKHLVAAHEASGAATPPWKFVSKVDDDSFVDAERFYSEFLLPRIDRPATADHNATVIARPLTRPERNYTAPGGQFYTLSWPIVTRLVALYAAAHPVPKLPEDTLIGRLLYDGGIEYEFVTLDDTRAFDVTADLHRVGMEREDLGRMDGRAINPHKMKDDELYLRVAGLFGREGFVGYGAGERG
ncbi:hypothetical protein BDR22DRAFT_974669 [Usnea florida]